MNAKWWSRAVGLAVAAVVMIPGQGSCGWGSPQYTLQVFVGEGIQGTPQSGTYVYNEFDTVDYLYDADADTVTPQIYLNSTRKLLLSGTVTMYTNIEMRVEQTDLRQEWDLIFKEDDQEDAEWRIIFSGATLRSGTFSDSNGRRGTWVVENKGDLTITYEDWADYVLTGTLTELSGTWTGEGHAGDWDIYPR